MDEYEIIIEDFMSTFDSIRYTHIENATCNF